ncbi:reverse transcriptase [Rhizoctonia solani 123E]|uniref:Reverse transcriptase n=1 Tax=Rhizoctonia solani 123E TaxID=1423351 RepID=A0A074S599_9AGAM|nr:reverse transcriptase [Rhizoctonia solani 123E]
MRKSNVLRLVALRKLDSSWWKNNTIPALRGMLTRLDGFFIKLKSRFTIVRQYEDKTKPTGEKTWRPVGAPIKSARMMLYIWYCFFSIYLHGYIGSYQHAYRKGKGLITAWSALSEMLPKYSYIYEFDLRAYFDSLNVSLILSKLQDTGLLEPLYSYIFDLQLNYPRLESLETDKLPEKSALFKAELDAVGLLRMNPKYPMEVPGWLFNESGEYIGEVLKPLFAELKSMGVTKFLAKYNEWIPTTLHEFQTDFMAVMYEFFQIYQIMNETKPEVQQHHQRTNETRFNANNTLVTKGFPQGGGLSPIFANFSFEYVLFRRVLPQLFYQCGVKDWKIIAYADDFIVFFNGLKSDTTNIIKNKFETLITQGDPFAKAAGIEFNLEKSGWIKTKGEYVVEKFKFLGKTFWPKLNLLEGTPRGRPATPYTHYELVSRFKSRSMVLKAFLKDCNLKPTLSRELIKLWGQRELPFSLIPVEVMEGTRGFSPEERRILVPIFSATLSKTGLPADTDFAALQEASSVLQEIAARAKSRMKAGQEWLELRDLTLEEFIFARGKTSENIPRNDDSDCRLRESLQENLLEYRTDVHPDDVTELSTFLLMKIWESTPDKPISKVTEDEEYEEEQSVNQLDRTSGSVPMILRRVHKVDKRNPFDYLKSPLRGIITAMLHNEGSVSSDWITGEMDKFGSEKGKRTTDSPDHVRLLQKGKPFMDYIPKSVGLRNVEKPDIFNASSYATHCALQSLRHDKKILTHVEGAVKHWPHIFALRPAED